jgi:glycerol-3-phosphate dehydrogenase
LLNTEVTGFSKSSGFQIVETTNGPVRAEFVINATGADGARVAAMADACNFSLQYFRGHLIIGDKNLGKLVKSQVSSIPRPGIMKLVYPLPSDNLMIGLIYTPTHEPHAIAADRTDLEEVFNRGQSLLPALTRKDVVSFFAMSRVYSARDPDEYIVECAPNNPRFINTVLRMPGFIPAPAIAKNIVEMLVDQGLPLTRKANFNPSRKAIPRFNELSLEKKRELIASNPKYGHVVCRCETVTEGEVVEAIKRGASTVDGVKFRTRAGMGRCQGGFCGTRVIEILARELNVDRTEVTKHGGHSRVLLYRGKELLKAGKKCACG